MPNRTSAGPHTVPASAAYRLGRTFTIAALALLVMPAAGQIMNEDLKLNGVGLIEGDRFGRVIAFDSGVVAVGAHIHSAAAFKSGSAYTFDATTGAQIAKLVPIDGAANDVFGWAVAIDNGVVAVGAVQDDDQGTSSGSVYLFDALTGAQLHKLVPSDGASADFFGAAVAFADGVVVVGAYSDDDFGRDSGSVYTFDAATGALIKKLTPNTGDVQASDWFGYSVAIDDGAVIVGAPRDDDTGSDAGSAFLFDAVSGLQITKFYPSDGEANEWFGYSVAIDKSVGSGVIAVGDRSDDANGTSSGSAYLFDATTRAEIAKLLPSDGAAFDRFGISIAADGGAIAVGASQNRDDGQATGSAYLFNSGASCPADINGDGVLNAFDVFEFLGDYDLGACTGPSGDYNGDGTCDAFDVFAFLGDYDNGLGCP